MTQITEVYHGYVMDTSWIIPTAAVFIAFLGLLSKMAAKGDIAELKADIREIRQMLFNHISDGHKHE